MNNDSFDLDSGALCLDFANTLEWQASDQPVDKLHDMADLIRWGAAAGILEPDQARELGESAVIQPEAAAAAFERALRLRDTIYQVFSKTCPNLPSY